MLAQNTGVKVFTATKAKEREEIGTKITQWLSDNPGVEILKKTATQSSDTEYHCVTVTVVYSKAE
jgi:hypothetical protein